MDLKKKAGAVREAAYLLSTTGSDQRNRALEKIAEALAENRVEIIQANRADLERGERQGLPAPLYKRLKFDEGKLQDAIEGIKSLIGLKDPIGDTSLARELDQGLELYRVSCPIGVIGIIFESRPDALVQISTLCLKSGNGVILKGGSEARETNRVLTRIIREASSGAGIPGDWICGLETREGVEAMLVLDDCIDLIIPRGSNSFVRYIMDHTRIPVMGHADGICHCYVDEDADVKMAVHITSDSKTQYVAVCNALETLLVHRDIAHLFLPELKRVMDEKGVTLLGCPKTCQIISVGAATEEDWGTEYLDLRLSVKVVENRDEAVRHINTYGSGHTDVIVTSSRDAAADFLARVDSGNVFWNCSTRFSDGYRYGFGAEVGISTGKLHARGPVGLEGLVTYKYKLLGTGQVVADYAERRKSFTHAPLNRDCPV
ncbi:MAG TPA: glutamate-5-semialdehyde dehydrogenase [Clostridiales bacterium]|nr:glutamate-5-semialdehyde dehydrogenase [Clostridiales bacterium]